MHIFSQDDRGGADCDDLVGFFWVEQSLRECLCCETQNHSSSIRVSRKQNHLWRNPDFLTGPSTVKDSSVAPLLVGGQQRSAVDVHLPQLRR